MNLMNISGQTTSYNYNKNHTMRKIKSLALTCITTLGILSVTHAQEKEAEKSMTDKESVAQINKVLGVGSDAPALEGVTWVQGDAVKSLNEKDKLYIIECWASWCGPCVAVIPHMNELHKKYSEKGLVIIGMNVWEEGIDKTQAFVKNQGEEMSYRVAYSGEKGSKFEKNWLEASNTQGIPQAFVIKDGKIIYKDHPAGLSEKNIEAMMASDFDAEKFAMQQASEREIRQAFSEKIRPLFQAGDWKAIKEIAMTDNYIKGKPDAAGLMSQANQQLGDWDAQAVLLKDIVADKYGADTPATALIGYSLISPEINDKIIAIAKDLEPLYATEGEPETNDYMGRLAQTRVLFMVGKKEDSKEKLQKIHEEVKKMAGQQGVDEFLKKIEDTIKSIDEGKYPPFN